MWDQRVLRMSLWAGWGAAGEEESAKKRGAGGGRKGQLSQRMGAERGNNLAGNGAIFSGEKFLGLPNFFSWWVFLTESCSCQGHTILIPYIKQLNMLRIMMWWPFF